MTFGGLALGVGMIVDAAIVVLENTQRHLEMGKPPRQAAIEGSEEIWSAILASTLTHVAVFVPLFFLTGFSSVLFRQLSVVVIFSLLMSLFVAVTIVPVLCSLLLTPPVPADQRTGITGRLFRWSERVLDGMDERLPQAARTSRSHHRPTVVAVSALLFVASIFVFPTLSLRADAADRRGRGHASKPRTAGRHPHRAHGGDDGRSSRTRIRKAVPEARTLMTAGRRPAASRARAASTAATITVILLAAQRSATRSNDADRARRCAAARRHARHRRPRPAVRRHSSSSASSAAAPTRGSPLEIRGYDLDDARRLVERRQGC